MFSLDSIVSGVLNVFNVASTSTVYEITPDSRIGSTEKQCVTTKKSEYSSSQPLALPQDQEYASPWEMPPLLCLKVSMQRDRALRKSALVLTKEKLIWLEALKNNEEYLPPKDFDFCLDYSAPFAIRGLRVDDSLKEAYCEFVPSKLDEETFWRQYFWHIELLKCQVTDLYQGVAIDFDEVKENMSCLRRVPSFANESLCQTAQLVFHLPRRSVIVREYLRYRLKELKTNGRDHSSSVDFEQPCTYDIQTPNKTNSLSVSISPSPSTKKQPLSDSKHTRNTRRVKFRLPDTNKFLRLDEIPSQLVETRERCKSM